MAAVKHKGKATQAALKLIFWTLVALLVVTAMGFLAAVVGAFIFSISVGRFTVWVVFSLFCLWFFRAPDARVPAALEVILAPAHGKLDVMDESSEPEFVRGTCRVVALCRSR